MKYMLLIYGDEHLFEGLPQEEIDKIIADTGAYQAKLRETGEWLSAYGVAGAAESKTVHLENGVPVVSDGPYLETKEYLGSFDIIECESMERAVEIAAGVPFARYGKVEIKALFTEA